MADTLRDTLTDRRSPLAEPSSAPRLLSAPQPAAIALFDSPHDRTPPNVPDTAAALAAGAGAWLVVSEGDAPATLMRQLTGQREGAAVTDVSHGRFRIRLQGLQARQVLQSGVAIDVQAPAFATGHSTPTTFREIAVLVHAADEQMFDLYVFRSYARSLWAWLVDAANIE